MIRELMVNGAKNIPANYAAKVAMVTGMGVQERREEYSR